MFRSRVGWLFLNGKKNRPNISLIWKKYITGKKISELKLASEKPTTKESENLEEIETF